MARLPALIKTWLHRAGLDIRRYPPQDDGFRYQMAAARRMQILRALKVNVVLDVGANVGQYALALRDNGYAGRIVSFEPQAQAFDLLGTQARSLPPWECRCVALGDRDGEATLHVSASSASSSLLPMKALHRALFPGTQYVGTETVALAQMDTLLPELLRAGDRACLKIDVQGLELDVLRGAAHALASACIPLIELEICLVRLYDHQPKPHVLLEFLDAAGYDCAALEQGGADPKTGHMLWMDGLFVRRLEADA